MTRLMTEPRVSSAQRERRLAPSTSCVQFSTRADLGERGGDVGGDHLVELAAEVGEQLPVALDRVGATAAGQAVVVAHVHAEQLAVRTLRHARRAPDQRLGARARP